MTQTTSTPTTRTMESASGERKVSVVCPILRLMNLIGQDNFLCMTILCNKMKLFSFNIDKSNSLGQRGEDCGSDAIGIPGGSLTGHGMSYERWCGSLFGAMNPTANTGSASENQVTTYRTPFRFT
jgi:hypothetical protein